MAQSSAVSTTNNPHSLPRPVLWLGAVVFLVTTILTLHGAHGRWEIPIVMTTIMASLVLVYGYLLPRKLAQPSAGGTALILSGLAVVLLLPAFWSGQSFILGTAGALLGHAGRRAPSGAVRSVVAVVLGLLAGVGYLAIYVIDATLPPGTA